MERDKGEEEEELGVGVGPLVRLTRLLLQLVLMLRR